MGTVQRYLKLPALLSMKIMQVRSNSMFNCGRVEVGPGVLSFSLKPRFAQVLLALSCTFIALVHFFVVLYLHGDCMIARISQYASTDLGTFSVCGHPSAQLCEARRFIFLTLATVAAQSEELSPQSNSASTTMDPV